MSDKAEGRAVPASVRALDAVVDALAGEVSASRARQLRMVVGMWSRALEMWPAGRRRPAGSAAGMFAEPTLRAFWDLAAAGRLRAREEDIGRELPVATLRIVRDCLGILAGEVVPGREVWLPVVERQDLKSAVAPGQLRVLYRRLVDMAGQGPLERDGTLLSAEDRTRLLAIVAVVLDTGARSGELAAQRVGDLDEDLLELRSVRRPQNSVQLPVQEAVWPLQPGTAVAVRRWLVVRDGLISHLEGTQSALWVSLQANQWQPEPGFALRAQGIRQAYARGVAALNWVMAGETGWEPLPGVLERLTRTVRSELGEEPRASARRPRGTGVRGRPPVELSDQQVAQIRHLLAVPSLSVDAVAQEAGISVPVLYRRFPEVRDRPGARRGR
ncbi:hypothetical protein [Streptomyces sp.]|uniref:hypothetical protein n=1 Tax=Streptomyces sp. TaxID=1931 RepID=UPI002F3F297A